MSNTDDMDLMRYFDGELSADEAAEVRAQLESSERDRTVLDSLGQISETTRTHLELSADEAEPRLGAMWQGIERRIHANGKADEAAAVAVPRTRSHDAQAGGVFAALRRWFAEQRGYFVTGTLAAGAAAAIMFFALPRGSSDGAATPATRDPIVATPINSAGPCATAPSVPARSEPAAVEELNVTDGTGYILTIPGEDGENDTTVIWIEPEDKLESPI